MTGIKDIDKKILSELIKNSKTSDRKLAKKLGVSQPTITRRRARLEKEGKLSYELIPELKKLGFEIMAFNFLIWQSLKHLELIKNDDYMKRVHEFISKHPEIVFASSGQGLEMTRIVITIHRSYSDYVTFRRKLETEWGEYIERLETFTISLKSDQIIRELTFKHLFNSLTINNEQPHPSD